jgi:hypothetical protein
MSEAFMPPGGGAATAPVGPPPPDGGQNPLTAALGAGPGGADVAQMPPELMAALQGGQQPPPEQQPEMEPASLEAAMEHFRMGIQMLQELQVGSTDDQEMHEIGGMMSPVMKMLADRQKAQAVASAGAPKLGGGGGGA